MDLEKINEEYSKLKTDIEKENSEVENLNKKVAGLEIDKMQAELDTKRAKLNGDKTAEKDAQNELNRIKEELKKAKEEAESKKANLTILKTKIQTKINKVKSDPEMKKHLDSILAKRYDRKISQLENDKKAAEGKKQSITNLKQLVTEHETLGNNLKGMMGASKKINDLKKELKDMEYDAGGGLIAYTDSKRANEIKTNLIPQAEAKLDANKVPLMSYITKKKLDITEQDIDEFVNQEFVVDGKGNIDLNTTMDRRIGSLNRQIKGYDKSIKHHQMSLNGLENIPTSGITHTPTDPSTTEKPKWYQFVKKFKNWNTRRKQQALPEPTSSRDKDSDTEPENASENKDKNFKNSLKYEIVQDIVKEEQKENLKKSKGKLKNQNAER